MATQPMSLFGVVKAFILAVWKAARQLFHEVTGALFFVIAIAALQSAWRVWHRGGTNWLIGLSCGYALLMIVFGIFSFRDAGRVR
jgi:hypothetical protein